MPRPARFGAAVAALLLAGCGGSTNDEARRDAAGVRATIDAFGEAFKANRFDDACALMTSTAQAETGEGDTTRCVDRLAYVRTLVSDPLADRLVKAMRDARIVVSGDIARSATRRGELGGGRYRYVGGRWLIDASS